MTRDKNIIKKWLKLSIPMLLLGLTFFILFFGRVFASVRYDDRRNLNERAALHISPDIFFRQTLNNCAPYSAMAVINILTGKKLDPEILAKETGWRIIKNLTFPQGLVDLLLEHSIKTTEYNLYHLQEDQKIFWIKNTIDSGKPIVFLVEIKHVKHYLTVLGYDGTGFMIYDSLQEKTTATSRFTIVDRPEYAGNRYYSYHDFLELWDAGGYLFFFRNWAVVCET